MTLEEAERECFIMTVGAQDTSASFVSAFVHFILQNPSKHAALIAEIDQYEEESRLSKPVARYDETTQMPYFMACCSEALRLSPSVSMVLPRFAPEGFEINGVRVTSKTELAANPYVIHRNEEIFGADPEEFRPERWLENPARVKVMNKYMFAFGFGSRRCIGKNIALFECQKFCVQVSRARYILFL